MMTMAYFYSAEQDRFYTSSDNPPPDAVPLEPRRGALFLEVQRRNDASAAAGALIGEGNRVTKEAIDAAIAAMLPDPAHLIEAQRIRRNQLLTESDHWFMPDRNLPEDKLAPWRAYRQQLRDLDFSGEVQWPTPPSAEVGKA